MVSKVEFSQHCYTAKGYYKSVVSCCFLTFDVLFVTREIIDKDLWGARMAPCSMESMIKCLISYITVATMLEMKG